MRNRVNTPARDEDAFINAGTATAASTPAKENKKSSKAKPVSISLSEDNLALIDSYIASEASKGSVRVNRSDVVRAAIMGLEQLSSDEISELISQAKLQ
ncbi:hypothetical protein R2223_004535 [Cronobacter sakazakii]|uniref:hypothetical protein n=1 Tax=Cronobacter sakazakii TaxID=28141 RepID=UPI0012A8D893|nr:hypothetical protein [Cronobacter sakazakii]EKS1074355.1 hypothetical protein [Cronobacter sakazakii]EKS1087721.1 hypothetical protein [Cronobacter sakazakii]ELQ5973844.1 hypothetical protein [Cronobacter sakazakii]ELQ6014864.1 hypothetical protein [Cronobacter sakazakii]ELQ6035847.1 hypothetical protein [Cronobacter sakazakii]